MPVSQVEAQKEYLIRTFYDLLQALREHPDWLEELRRIIYTTELSEVPKKLDELIESFEKYKKEEFKPLKESHEKFHKEFKTFREKEFKPLKESHEDLREEFQTFREKEFKPLKEGFETFREKEFKPLKESHEKLREEFQTFREKEFKPLKEKVDRIERDVEILKQDVTILKEDVKYLKVEVGDLKGDNFERKVREKFALFFGKLLRKAKVLSQEELLERLSEAEERGIISEEEFDEILRLDVIVEGVLKHAKKPVALAVEVSVSLYPEDIERASLRAYALSKVLKKEVIPVTVFKRGKPELEEMASEKGVLLIKAPED